MKIYPCIEKPHTKQLAVSVAGEKQRLLIHRPIKISANRSNVVLKRNPINCSVYVKLNNSQGVLNFGGAIKGFQIGNRLLKMCPVMWKHCQY